MEETGERAFQTGLVPRYNQAPDLVLAPEISTKLRRAGPEVDWSLGSCFC